MTDPTSFNQQRWDDLSRHKVYYARPWLDITPDSARRLVDEYGLMGDVAGKDVLALASGGGQQSVAFALLGATTTVVDFSAEQLARDQEALDHHGLTARLVQSDMRDLSAFPADSFDVVWHAYSISFIPDPQRCWDEVKRVLRPGGLYRMEWHNPLAQGLDERDYVDGRGYAIHRLYQDGSMQNMGELWDIWQEDGRIDHVAGPEEFCHTLRTVMNSLLWRGFQLLGLWESGTGDSNAEAGTWEHFTAVMPPWLTTWWRGPA